MYTHTYIYIKATLLAALTLSSVVSRLFFWGVPHYTKVWFLFRGAERFSPEHEAGCLDAADGNDF